MGNSTALAKGQKALIVEDDVQLAELLSEVLSRMGFETSMLHAGSEVASRVRQFKPDVVLLDLMLPDRSGYDICEELKLDRETNLVPIIIVTARAQHEDKVRGLRVGANYYLTKPFAIDQLEDAIRKVLEWRGELQRTGAEGEIHFQMRSDTQY